MNFLNVCKPSVLMAISFSLLMSIISIEATAQRSVIVSFDGTSAPTRFSGSPASSYALYGNDGSFRFIHYGEYISCIIVTGGNAANQNETPTGLPVAIIQLPHNLDMLQPLKIIHNNKSSTEYVVAFTVAGSSGGLIRDGDEDSEPFVLLKNQSVDFIFDRGKWLRSDIRTITPCITSYF